MKIAHYMPESALGGGISSYLWRLVRAQQDAGNEAIVLDDDPHLPHMCSDGSQRNDRPTVNFEDADPSSAAAKLNCDILHAHVALDLSRRIQLPTVRTVHAHWPYCPSGSRYLKRRGVACPRKLSVLGCTYGHVVDRCGSVRPSSVLQTIARVHRETHQLRVVRVLANSEFVLREMRRSKALNGPGVVLLLPAPEISPETMPAATTDARPIILCAGRLTYEKGIHSALDIVGRLKTKCIFRVVGSGPLEDLVRGAAARKGDGSIELLGWQSEEQMLHHYAQAAVVLFPSIWPEPAGLVTLEAAAAGRPVVAAAVGGIPEYAAKCGNTLLYSPGDLAGAATAIDELLKDESLRVRLGSEGRRNALLMSTFAHSLAVQRQYELAISAFAEEKTQ